MDSNKGVPQDWRDDPVLKAQIIQNLRDIQSEFVGNPYARLAIKDAIYDVEHGDRRISFLRKAWQSIRHTRRRG